MGIIYMFTSPSGKKYIGQTINSFKLRKSKHVSEAMNPPTDRTCSTCFHAAIRKYGIDNFIEEILIEINNEFLNEYETKFIKAYNTLSPFGYNLKEGGASNHYSEESRKKMSESRKKLIESSPTYLEHMRTMASKQKVNQSLPMYVIEITDNDKTLVGYKVHGHPNSPNVRKFQCKTDVESAYTRAMEYYNYLESLSGPIHVVPNSPGRKRQETTKDLPKYIVQVKNDITKEIIGYAVNGYQLGFHSKSFTNSDMKQNLENAKQFLEKQLEIKAQRLNSSG
jgi:group I intron endonuclease